MNPMQMLNMIMANNPSYKNNPMVKNAIDMMQNGNSKGLKELAENLAKQKGVNINDLISQYNLK